MRVTYAIAVIAMMLAAGPASAQQEEELPTIPNTIGDLYMLCKAPANSLKKTICMPYVAGVADELDEMGGVFCGKTTYGTIVDAFVNWAERHPLELSAEPMDGIAAALKEAWPCK